jgi:hypothetical protein
MLRAGFGDAAYRRYNRTLRDAGRDLNVARDAAVLVETVRKLRRGSDGLVVKRFLGLLMRQLRAERRGPAALEVGMLGHWSAIQRTMRDIQCTPKTQFRGIGAEKGLVRAYRSARTAYRRATQKPTDARLHEWRKQVKYRYCETASQARRTVRKMHRQANDLAQLLGEDHDLSVLRLKIVDLCRRGVLPGDAHSACLTIIGRVQQQRMRLQQKALRLGGQCYRMKIREFRDRTAARMDRATVRVST